MRRWLRRIGVALLGLVVASTIASFAYNAATNGRERPANRLYAGPFVAVDGTQVAYRRWGHAGSPILLIGGFVEPTWVWRRARCSGAPTALSRSTSRRSATRSGAVRTRSRTGSS